MTPHHHTLRIRTALGLVLAVGAIAPAAAAARVNYPIFSPASTNAPTPTNANAQSAARVREGSGFVSSPASPYVSKPGVRVVLVRQGGGFDWGDAIIGAAGGLGLSILGLAGARGMPGRRGRRTTGPATAGGS